MQENNGSKPAQRPAGFNCPNCQFFIEVSVHSLLYATGHTCPGCHTQFTMNRGESKEALELVQKLHVAMENVQKSKEFKR